MKTLLKLNSKAVNLPVFQSYGWSFLKVCCIFQLFILPFISLGQNTCQTATTLDYSSDDTTFVNYPFDNDSIIWLSFTTKDISDATLLISADTIGGAFLKSLTIYSGSCNNLQNFYQVNYTNNDSLSIYITNLTQNQEYKIKIVRNIINNCFSCYENIDICLVNIENTDSEIIFEECEPYPYEVSLVNHTFAQISPEGFLHPGYVTWVSGSTVGRSHIGENAKFWFSKFQGMDYLYSPNTDSIRHFLMSDLAKFPKSAIEPTVWKQTVTLETGANYRLSFAALNLDDTLVLYKNPQYVLPSVMVIVDGIQLSPSNVSNNGLNLTVNLQMDNTWHLLCYDFTSRSQQTIIEIKQDVYGSHGGYSMGHDLGIDEIHLYSEYEPNENGGKNSLISNENESVKMNVKPNPASEVVTFEFSSYTKQNSVLEICTIDNRILKRINLPEDLKDYQLSVSDLKDGCYIVRIKGYNGNTESFGKICVIH